MRFIPEHLVNSVISAIAIISGALIGALCSYIITKNNTIKNMEQQHKIMEENIKHKELYRCKQICQNANIIRLDICNALFQSIRVVKDFNANTLNNLYPIPMNKNYSITVACLSDKYSLKELSYIYQLYALIEKLNYDILNCDLHNQSCYQKIIDDYKDVLIKVYGKNYLKIFNIDIDNIGYRELFDNEYTKIGFKKVLVSLDEICDIENLNKKNN